MTEQYIPRASSNISEVTYDRTTGDMAVRFVDGSLYAYRNVPEEAYRGMQNAPSAGGYFYRHIRNVYAYEQVE